MGALIVARPLHRIRNSDGKKDSESRGSTAHLLNLPAEIHMHIADSLDDGALISLRRVCRILEKNSNDTFMERFFTSRAHLITTKSLEVLRNITEKADFARHIKEIDLVTAEVGYFEKYPSWYVRDARRAQKILPKTLNEILRNLARVSSRPTVKLYGERVALNDNLRIYGLKNYRATSDLTMSNSMLRSSFDINTGARDLLFAMANYPPMIKGLQLGSSHTQINPECALARSASSLPQKLSEDKLAELRPSWACIASLQMTLIWYQGHEHPIDSDLYQLISGAPNVTSLEIFLTCRWNQFHETLNPLVHLKLQHLAIGGGQGSLDPFRDILASYRNTLASLSINHVEFDGEPSEGFELLRWIGRNMRLKVFAVKLFCLRDHRMEPWKLQNEHGAHTFKVEDRGEQSVAETLEHVGTWATFKEMKL